MKKPRFLVLPLVLLAFICMGFLATPHASAHTLLPSPNLDSGCTPSIDVIASEQDTPRTITISLNDCAKQLIRRGISPDQISTFVVTFQFSGFFGLPFSFPPSTSSNGLSPFVQPPYIWPIFGTPWILDDATAESMRTIVATQLINLANDYTTCGNTNATLTTWGDVNPIGTTPDEYYQQLVTNAAVQTGCNQGLTPGA